ncbi:hypothetical protein J9303_16390 [Bacillaceae bacterium Marseille-Q3522]|nr:hypothetical protein [Bacillaceae bacterium Marseille-Q3522]
MKKTLQILTIFVLGMLVFVGNTTLADSKESAFARPIVGEAAANPFHGVGSIDKELGIQAIYLRDGISYIRKLSSTSVSVSGRTTANFAVNTVAVDLYLQRWDSSNGIWKDVFHVGEIKAYQTSSVYGTKNVNVLSNKYYRTRAVHWVQNGGTKEQNVSYSGYVYVY